MINHVVLFKLKEFASPAEKATALETFKQKLIDLKSHIPELKYIEVGKHHALETDTFDLCLISHFKSMADLDIYRVHPEHMHVVDFVKEITVARAAVDYEF